MSHRKTSVAASALNALADAALALLYPQVCLVCERVSVEERALSPACRECWLETRLLTGAETMCWKCGAPAAAEVSPERRESVRCRRCEAEQFTAARAVGLYEGALRAAVIALKREPRVSAHLAKLLVETARRPPLNAATRIIPVPLHPTRRRERGFNQASVIARAVAHATGLPLDDASLARTLYTEQHRAGMDRRTRRETVEGGFASVRPRLIAGEAILLVDDVFTTGATASACASALRTAGAREVFVLTIARA